jgi:hypothetical protein
MMSEMSGKEKYKVVYVYASADPHLGFLYQFRTLQRNVAHIPQQQLQFTSTPNE